jgi:hypothetical protein
MLPSGECASRKKERISGQKRSHYKTGLHEDDEEQDCISPDAVVADDLTQILVQVKDEIDQGLD